MENQESIIAPAGYELVRLNDETIENSHGEFVPLFRMIAVEENSGLTGDTILLHA